jgi:PrsW family intramembrane metalloprotease
VPSPGRLGAALAIPVAGILHVIGRDLYDGYRGRLKTEPAIGQEEVPMSSPDAPDRADGMARTVDTPGGPVVRDRRCPTNSFATATALSPASSIVHRQPAVIPLGWDHRVAGAPVPLHGVRLTDSDPSMGLSRRPTTTKARDAWVGPAGSGVHSRASEKPSLPLRRHAHSSLVLRCAVAGALKADREVQARATWLVPVAQRRSAAGCAACSPWTSGCHAFAGVTSSWERSASRLVETEVLRGLLTPVGHGLRTAILGGVLFRTAARTGRLRLSSALVGWYVVVALLHTLWDASRPIAVWLTLLLTASQVQWLLIRMGRVPQPTQAQVHTFTMINWGLLLLDALVGLAILRGRWRQALALEHAQPAPGLTP